MPVAKGFETARTVVLVSICAAKASSRVAKRLETARTAVLVSICAAEVQEVAAGVAAKGYGVPGAVHSVRDVVEEPSAIVEHKVANDQFHHLGTVVEQKATIEQLEHINAMMEHKVTNERFQQLHAAVEQKAAIKQLEQLEELRRTPLASFSESDSFFPNQLF